MWTGLALGLLGWVIWCFSMLYVIRGTTIQPHPGKIAVAFIFFGFFGSVWGAVLAWMFRYG